MKKTLILSLLCVMLFSIAALPASASKAGSHIFVDGVLLQSKSVSKNGVSFVPFRELFEKLKMNIGFDAKKNQVTGTKNGLSIAFTIGSKTAYVNGQKKSLNAAPFSQNGTTYIPVRIVGEATGNAVYFAASANVIQINSPSFKGVSYTIDGVTLLLQSNGQVQLGSAAQKEQKLQQELAEIAATRQFTENAPKIRIVGVPPTAEQSKDPGYKGYPDYFDENYGIAQENNEKLPPLMSQGWISLAMLSEIEGVNNLGSSQPDTITIGKNARYDIVLTPEYKKAQNGDFVLSDLRVKKYKGTMYLNIGDLKAAGIIVESNSNKSVYSS